MFSCLVDYPLTHKAVIRNMPVQDFDVTAVSKKDGRLEEEIEDLMRLL